MIKAAGRTKEGKPLIILGLSRMNCQKLLEGKPIPVNLNELGMEGTLLIVGGDTEESIQEELSALFRPDTVVES